MRRQMLLNNALALCYHVLIDIMLVLANFLSEGVFHHQVPSINRCISLIGISLYVFLGSKLRPLNRRWQGGVAVCSVTLLNIWLYCWCYFHMVFGRGGVRDIVWLLYLFGNMYGVGFAHVLPLGDNWLILSTPVPSLLLWLGIELRKWKLQRRHRGHEANL